jgi:hypothetical protein
MPVVDRGDTYNPPTAHQGAPIKDQSPVGIAELTVTYLHSMIEGAAKLA